MPQPHRFDFSRERGLVWVCDIDRSSQYLNDNSLAEAIEAFLPRFNWLSRIAVNAIGGTFVKWTGDGFLAWFPYELHRDMGAKASAIFDMVWHMSLLCNVTCLEVNTNKRFLLRHGVAVEHDALVTKISGDRGDALDLIGRGVVLAFRLSGIRVPFPGIITQREIAEAAAEAGSTKIHFKSLKLRVEDRLKYFKGERFGTSRLVATAKPPTKRASLRATIRSSKKVIAKAESEISATHPNLIAISKLLDEMRSGPQWSIDSADHCLKFIREDLLGTLKSTVAALEDIEKKGRHMGQ